MEIGGKLFVDGFECTIFHQNMPTTSYLVHSIGLGDANDARGFQNSVFK
jgi:hypothetical protein